MTLLDVIEAGGDRRNIYLRMYFSVILLLFLVSSLGFVAQWDAVPGKTAHTAVDFDAFHLVGQLILNGSAASAYDAPTLFKLEIAAFGQEIYLPWSYPPQFNLVVGTLAILPIGLAYCLFVAITFAAYVIVLRYLAEDNLATILFVMTPAIVVLIKCGQNGFLTGALYGWACLWLLHRGAVAGLPLSCLVIKPHLAVGLAIVVGFRRRWGVVAIAIAGLVATSLLATVAMGVEVWTAFLGSIPQTRLFLETGAYPLFRMVSPYAAVFTLGLPASAAIAAQAVVALGVLAAIMGASRLLPNRQSLGLAVIGALLISPYVYDYDTVIIGVGIALLLPTLKQLASARERLAIYGLTFATGAFGLCMTFIRMLGPARSEELAIEAGSTLPSLGGWTLIALFALVSRVLVRGRDSVPAGEPVPATA